MRPLLFLFHSLFFVLYDIVKGLTIIIIEFRNNFHNFLIFEPADLRISNQLNRPIRNVNKAGLSMLLLCEQFILYSLFSSPVLLVYCEYLL